MIVRLVVQTQFQQAKIIVSKSEIVSAFFFYGRVKKGSSSISGEGIDLCWERWICLLLLGGTTSVSSATDA